MQRNFKETIEELGGLINEWSASSADAPVVLLAVSGGVDSMCMAELFSSLEEPVPFAVAHCNFRLRGEDSDADQALVTGWAEKHSVPLHVTSFDTEDYAARNGISIEMAARELRYGWFAGLCSQHGYRAVAVAHNANDNAETLLLNLLRGSGLRGVTGMSVMSSLPCAPDSGVLLLRPLLKCTRKQIEGYAFAHKVQYREDRTNAMSEYRRNRLRNEVFPIFETINPSFIRTLNREASYFEDALDIVEDYCSGLQKRVVSKDGDVLRIDLPALLSCAHWRYLIYHILEPYGFNSSVLESLENLLTSDRTISGKRFDSAGYVLRTERRSLVVMEKMTGQAGHDDVVTQARDGHDDVVTRGRDGHDDVVTRSRDGHDDVVTRYRDVAVIPGLTGDPFIPVRGAGACHCNGRRFVVEVLPWSAGMPLKQPAGTLIFDADRLKFPFVCRGWRNGDWMIPLGMRGKKKLSDMFTDLKYSSMDKESALVLVDCNGDMAEKQHVAALLGVRIDDRYKVSERTTSVIRITI